MKTLFYFILSSFPSSGETKLESEFPISFYSEGTEADLKAKVVFYNYVRQAVIRRGERTRYGLPPQSFPVNDFKESVLACGIYDARREYLFWEDGDYTRSHFDCSDGEFWLCCQHSESEEIFSNYQLFHEFLTNVTA